MAGRHSARADNIHIIKTLVVPDKDVQRAGIQQFLKKNVRFPKFTITKRAPMPAQHSVFKAKRPTLI